jgi:type IV secretory pathway VirJ component
VEPTRRRWWGLLGALLLTAPIALCGPSRARATEKTLEFGRFGTVTLYSQVPQPSAVVLFVSGDGGWNLGVVDMARTLAGLDALVVGVNITHYLHALESSDEPCSYPASDFELLSKFAQKEMGFPDYITPILVGYSSGATLVYAALVQAPSNTFGGAISMGFCPDLPLTKPMCKGSGLEWGPGPQGKGVSFLPAKSLEVPWIALQGTIDQVCDPAAVGAYVSQVPHGEVVSLPKVGHGFSVPRNWEPQFKQAFDRLAHGRSGAQEPGAEQLGVRQPPSQHEGGERSGGQSGGQQSSGEQSVEQRSGEQRSGEQPSGQQPSGEQQAGGQPSPSANDLSDLPLTEVEPETADGGAGNAAAAAGATGAADTAGTRGLAGAGHAASDELAVIVTGDGGWSITERGLSKAFVRQGIPVVGLSSLHYFWKRRTPDEASKDLERILRSYMTAWNKDHAILIGYSLGADVLAFMANRLPPDLLDRVRSIVLLGPAHMADFEFHISEWLGTHPRPTALPVLPEVEKLRGRKLLCIYGASEKDTLCPDLPPGLAHVVRLHGGHLVWRGIAAIGDTILAATR